MGVERRSGVIDHAKPVDCAFKLLSPKPDSYGSICPSDAVDVTDDSFALARRCLRRRNIANTVTSAASRGIVVAKAMRAEVLMRPDGGDDGVNDDGGAGALVAGAFCGGASCGDVGAAAVGW